MAFRQKRRREEEEDLAKTVGRNRTPKVQKARGAPVKKSEGKSTLNPERIPAGAIPPALAPGGLVTTQSNNVADPLPDPTAFVPRRESLIPAVFVANSQQILRSEPRAPEQSECIVEMIVPASSGVANLTS